MSEVPLPVPVLRNNFNQGWYTADQMHAYAAAQSAADNKALRAEVERLTKVISDAWGEA